MRAAGSCASSSATPPAWARPMPCSTAAQRERAEASTSSSATSNRTVARRPRRCSKGWKRCRRSGSLPRRRRCASSISMRRCVAGPQLMLVDELAHTNAEGLRHAKRWQDVDELLDAGIDVWTTLNVQHIESLNDVIAQITGVVVRETLPDAVLEQADEIELIDLTPEELVERLQAGKVYLPQQAERALQELLPEGQPGRAARTVAAAGGQSPAARRGGGPPGTSRRVAPWLTTERLLVCVGPSPSSARIVRSGQTAGRVAGVPSGWPSR